MSPELRFRTQLAFVGRHTLHYRRRDTPNWQFTSGNDRFAVRFGTNDARPILEARAPQVADALRFASPLAAFSPATADWFRSAFAEPTAAQTEGWPAIAAGEHTLICAPTGSGKTLAAFLWCLDRLMSEPLPEDPLRRLRVLYVSPLKALVHDVNRNLRSPLAGIALAARNRGEAVREVTVAMRTGDTPAEERRAFGKKPPDILVTTPESLYLLLTSQAREALRGVEWVIVDEIHALAGTKRGAHLAISLERLEALTAKPPQRIGLSATQRPLSVVAGFLGGRQPAEAGDATTAAQPRPVRIVDAGVRKTLEIEVVVPVEDMSALGEVLPIEQQPGGSAAAMDARSSIWPQIHPRILELIRAHRSTIVFVNSRRLAERLALKLNELAGEELVRAHHGSLAREERLLIEEGLKDGRLPALVATSSLELGIDMGSVDLVIQVESPGSVARGLQRIGRAGHQVGEPSKGVIFPKYRGDLLECAVVTRQMLDGEIEPTVIPRNPLDVLAQQLVATAADRKWLADDLYDLVRRAENFADLGRDSFEATLGMLAGHYPGDEFAELRPRVVWDRTAGTVETRRDARTVAVISGGTIPDRGLFGVYLMDDADAASASSEGAWRARRWPARRRARRGDGLRGARGRGDPPWARVRGGSSRSPTIGSSLTRRRASRARSRSGRAMARAGRSSSAARWASSRARSPKRRPTERADASAPRSASRTSTSWTSSPPATCSTTWARSWLSTGALPTDQTIVLQRFRDELGDWRICLLTPFGARVHAPWALAIEARLREKLGLDVQPIWSDDGVVIRLPMTDELGGEGLGGGAESAAGAEPWPRQRMRSGSAPKRSRSSSSARSVDRRMFSSRFRENAARALLLPRRRAGQRTPLWQMRQRSAQLLSVASRYGSFPIILETYRECLQDVFDLPALKGILASMERREIRARERGNAARVAFRELADVRLHRLVHVRGRRAARRPSGAGPCAGSRPAARAARAPRSCASCSMAKRWPSSSWSSSS